MRNFKVEVTRWQSKYERGPTGTDHWQQRSWLQPAPHKTRACCLPGRARAGRHSRAGWRTNAPPRRTGCRLPRRVSRKSGPESVFVFDFFSKFDHPVLHPGREGRAQSSSKFHPQFFFPEGALATCERSPCREARGGSGPLPLAVVRVRVATLHRRPRSLFLTMEFTPMWHGQSLAT
jgi:hypothetical protein